VTKLFAFSTNLEMDVSISKRSRASAFCEYAPLTSLNKPARKTVEMKSSKHKLLGTPDYISPEMITGASERAESMDWWAIGCILYEFIIGIPPFNDDTVEKIWDNALNLRIQWPSVGYEEGCISPEAKDLIEKLLTIDVNKRITNLEDFKKHDFFKGFDFSSLFQGQPPMVPKLNKINYEKTSKISFDEIFELDDKQGHHQGNQAHNTIVKKIKRHNLEIVRFDILHEENFNLIAATV
jgi:serine/threonine protein kinase